jgi:hypothetical protein
MLGNLLPGPTVVYESLRSGTSPWRLKEKGACMFKVVREIHFTFSSLIPRRVPSIGHSVSDLQERSLEISLQDVSISHDFDLKHTPIPVFSAPSLSLVDLIDVRAHTGNVRGGSQGRMNVSERPSYARKRARHSLAGAEQGAAGAAPLLFVWSLGPQVDASSSGTAIGTYPHQG